MIGNSVVRVELRPDAEEVVLSLFISQIECLRGSADDTENSQSIIH